MLKKLLTILAVALVGLVAFIATRPTEYHVERSVVVRAPIEAVFASISDLRAFTEWSPWEKRDPSMKKSFSPNTSGVGASYSWQGNKEVGSGKMTITESTPPTRVRERLEFIEPFASVAQVTFEATPAGAGEVKTTWSMDGQNNFVGKAMGLVMNMDQMIGKDFEAGLAAMKSQVEAKASATPPAAAPAEPTAVAKPQ